ncbi:protein kinase domain-containing protein [Cellvibrio sp. NN19]|uniref:protein kinase domain-containing protein n=1 Tax=Cellvibrio chitinivorans TaxID=3102792 RepID=UPI002B403C3B|nr:protein kinase [Cellvibrio sp. NN19]
MNNPLRFNFGQYSDRGRKEVNQDFHGISTPDTTQLESKGLALAIADGISTSNLSHIASATAVNSFFSDYYCTSDAWSVKKSGQQVLAATNSWLYSLTRQSQFRFDKDRGYVCTFSALVIKSATAHVFHVGDSRVYRLRHKQLELLTEDHRQQLSQHESVLSRALGIDQFVEMDYRAASVEAGDVFILCTDGVYEHLSLDEWLAIIDQHGQSLDTTAQLLAQRAFDNGSDDNLTVQLLRIDQLADQTAPQVYQQLTELPFAPALDARSVIDGYQITRELKITSRSHVYLASDMQTGEKVVLKFPSVDQRDDPVYLERFLLEEWIARRLNSAHILKPCSITRPRNYVYVAMEYIEGQSLAQWLVDNPSPSLETVRKLVEQIAKGLQAFHRMEMLHQDLRPENILIDPTGTVKIIDFGSTRVAGLAEIDSPLQRSHLAGTALYSAPEYFLGEAGLPQSDQFSLAVITYHLLSGRYPYGTQVAQAKTRAAQKRLNYQSVLDDEREIPAWIDHVLRKALHPNPYKRYTELSEFVYDLRQPNQVFIAQHKPPLIERNPVGFWQGVSLILLLIVIALTVELLNRT